MGNSLIMMTTTTPEAVLAGGIIPLTTVQRGKCRALRAGSNSIVINEPGNYFINATDTFTAPVAGTVNMKLQLNGIDIPGITASTTVTTADTEVRSLAINGFVKVCCCDLPATLTLVNGGVAVNTSNVEIAAFN